MVGEGGRYVVCMSLVQYVVDMWSVHMWSGKAVSMWSVCGRYVVGM